MNSINFNSLDLSPAPDLHPLYPTQAQISNLLSSNSGLSPSEKSELVAHCATRACVFGDLSILQYLLTDPQVQGYLDLSIRDEDGLGLVSLTIQGFGGDIDRDVEREECVRLLVTQGADMQPDNAGWTPLHHAALFSPPTLISYLMTHGCSPFALTKRNLTPLDIVTAHSVMPGREDVALLLEEAMRSEGWEGGRMDRRRRLVDQQQKRRGRRKELREDVARVLGIHPAWWGDKTQVLSDSESSDDEDEDVVNEDIYTPPLDYSSMLVFSPPSLPRILESLVTNYPPSLRDSTPANALYMLTRFACLTCDHTWLEDLMLGATDTIEEAVFNRPDDLAYLVFWLYNTTLWLHFTQCDNSINETCDIMGCFDLIEEVINSVFVFIIRFAEKRLDQMLQVSLLDYSPGTCNLQSIEFESEWSFLKTLTGKKKTTSNNTIRGALPKSPPRSGEPSTPTQNQPITSSTGFSSLRQTFSRRSQHTPRLSSLFDDGPSTPSDVTEFLSALHSFFIMSDINPALITQLWSQVFYWTTCEMFNRIITRRDYLCRSRATQISLNLTVLEEWIAEAGLPPGIQTHFIPVRNLLNWLQCLSSISEFPDLVATIQSMKTINPLQMRRALRDYKYEVNESRMTEECAQYLTQLQKDWERHRVKMGVEAMRKEISERERDRESISSLQTDSADQSSEISNHQLNVDILFDKTKDKLSWEPIKPPQPLGELLDSRYMIPLLFPSDPRLLAALPRKLHTEMDPKPFDHRPSSRRSIDSRSSSVRSQNSDSIMSWRNRNRRIREVDIGTLHRIDGPVSAARWGKSIEPRFADDGENEEDERKEGAKFRGSLSLDNIRLMDDGENETMKIDTHVTPLTMRPSFRIRGRSSMGETTPVDQKKREL